MRTHLCGKIDESLIGNTVSVCGWVQARRDHGGVIFIDLRDRSGVLQLVADPEAGAEMFANAETTRSEYVVRGTGEVRARPEGSANPNLSNGSVEVALTTLEILNAARPLSFAPDEEGISEEIRLRHRIVDLRGGKMSNNLRRRYAMARAARDWFGKNDFVEIETPMLARATPEGARDFLTPSRLQAGAFYALPQSPQLFKQMLMAAGFERYFQVTRCFRDEDLRADRQPEFSQIDVEMSFADEEEIMHDMEAMACAAFFAAGVELPQPFPRMTFAEAMSRFGNDRPDLRNKPELTGVGELTDVGDIMKKTEFKVFRDPADDEHGRVAALRLRDGGSLSRGEIDNLTDYILKYGAKGLAYIKVENKDDISAGLRSPIVKFLSPEVLTEILSRTGAENGDMIFFGAGREDVVNASLSALRNKLAQDSKKLKDGWFPLWVIDFPLFERDYQNNVWHARHHPFTSPRAGDEELVPDSPGKAQARAYDMILNGVEIGGGGIRNHRPDVQLRVFAALGMDEAASREKFGFLLTALESGAPPHGGIALGLDRMAAMACGAESIRDVIAFPKTQRGQCLLTGAPSEIDAEQLRELHLRPSPTEQKSSR